MRLPFTAPWLLAPMEGVTEPCYRELLLECNPPEALGGAFTEFVRVLDRALPRRVLEKHLGPARFAAPVGLQLMGAHPKALEATAAAAVEAGAPLLDVNFGCPAKGALKSCAGSAALRDPALIESALQAVARGAAGAVPVTAKLRAGYDHADDIEQLARAAEAGGAALITVHCRTRLEHYAAHTDWTRIARAVEAVEVPICGNGGVSSHTDLEAMRAATGCALVMVGQAALGNPWIFSGERVSRARAARFLLDYAALLSDRRRTRPQGVAGRIKQLLRHWTAGDLLGADRFDWLHEKQPTALLARLEKIAGRP
ncbi:MAG: tRNA-dihydrouridine synthase family protein [bacterium]|nr:tRNA-dihydrouridine synthase family protein [Planctomycetota bacterium]HIL51474.1 tRNA-dihydrouridine synthase family protein [Planctomycetota bacterium]